ncbi:copper resistance protein NlpE N-terminal domain-containing protein [Arenimonas sp.]|uniref:copper resistance protein NlpE N-terminal domain-containing protein n=1 Tax=Arenimonas sp. TaxID=1872635 RepID=UPI002E3325BB|nr:copper resistance protein NlpE N-terminal domain-containing protein [Arenimonas sp.]HEX4853366.1 copper resistance protein NlpE N-terminal domain-containing protein [Arenimonas sp.]
MPAFVLLGLVALAGCGREGGDAAPAPPAPAQAESAPAHEAEAFDRSWLGVLPCADCDGIQTRLQLRADADGARYLLEETYLGGEGNQQFLQEGEWREETVQINGAPAVVYRLDPDGPARWFWLQPDGALEMLEAEGRPAVDGVLYRLQRL